jgi:hypothetical protein
MKPPGEAACVIGANQASVAALSILVPCLVSSRSVGSDLLTFGGRIWLLPHRHRSVLFDARPGRSLA